MKTWIMGKFCYAKVLQFMDLMKKIFASVFFFFNRCLLFILSRTNYVSRHRLVLFSCKTLLSRLKQRWEHLSIRPPNILGLLTCCCTLKLFVSWNARPFYPCETWRQRKGIKSSMLVLVKETHTHTHTIKSYISFTKLLNEYSPHKEHFSLW